MTEDGPRHPGRPLTPPPVLGAPALAGCSFQARPPGALPTDIHALLIQHWNHRNKVRATRVHFSDVCSLPELHPLGPVEHGTRDLRVQLSPLLTADAAFTKVPWGIGCRRSPKVTVGHLPEQGSGLRP